MQSLTPSTLTQAPIALTKLTFLHPSYILQVDCHVSTLGGIFCTSKQSSQPAGFLLLGEFC